MKAKLVEIGPKTDREDWTRKCKVMYEDGTLQDAYMHISEDLISEVCNWKIIDSQIE